MSEFERENRYIVIKRKDADKYLDPMLHSNLNDILGFIERGRKEDGKALPSYVLVREDWPMYEEVWGMIEAFVEAKRLEEVRKVGCGRYET